jgi:hypothetical protein
MAKNMCKLLQFPASPGSNMKALIIYDDFASAARANAALQQSARNLDHSMEWEVIPWRSEVLKYPESAAEMLTDALDAHLIVITARSAQSTPLGLKCWLNHWAKCRRIKSAAVALVTEGSTFLLSALAGDEMPTLADQHGFSIFFDKSQNPEDKINIIALSSIEPRLLPPAPLKSFVALQIQQGHPRWGINE